jgi:predicted TIM-barrel fold metal-dependent hydrolase
MHRIDTHQHLIPDFYLKAMQDNGMGGGDSKFSWPQWSPESAAQFQSELGIDTAILSVSTPGTTILPRAADAAALARDLNDYTADFASSSDGSFGFFATVAMPHVAEVAAEAGRAIDDLHADGVVLLANSSGTYLGESGQDDLFAALDAREAVVLIHPAELPGPPADGMPGFAADFLLDTTRAAYLLVRNDIRRTYPRIRFILSHGGGFVPYAAHRLAMTIALDTGRTPEETLPLFSSFYFDTALSSSPAALPSLLAFADPGHITFGSDWPFAPPAIGKYFADHLATYLDLDETNLRAINRDNALPLFPRLAASGDGG